jgi:DNA-binding CsgD family transcriptional regulator
METAPLRSLTAKQREVHRLTVDYYVATGEGCSLAYLARRLKKNRTAVRQHLHAIAAKGWATTPAFRCLLLEHGGTVRKCQCQKRDSTPDAPRVARWRP